MHTYICVRLCNGTFYYYRKGVLQFAKIETFSWQTQSNNVANMISYTHEYRMQFDSNNNGNNDCNKIIVLSSFEMVWSKKNIYIYHVKYKIFINNIERSQQWITSIINSLYEQYYYYHYCGYDYFSDVSIEIAFTTVVAVVAEVGARVPHIIVYNPNNIDDDNNNNSAEHCCVTMSNERSQIAPPSNSVGKCLACDCKPNLWKFTKIQYISPLYTPIYHYCNSIELELQLNRHASSSIEKKAREKRRREEKYHFILNNNRNIK